MAIATLIWLMSADGKNAEAVALARDGGVLLPPGRWKIAPTLGAPGEIMNVEQMPAHWRDQLHVAGEFGKTLNDLESAFDS